jgi:hypothetical protein
LTYEDGRVELVAQCPLSPAAAPPGRGHRGRAAGRRAEGEGEPPPVWDGWPQHLWFGKSFATWTHPALPANESVAIVSAEWTVPPRPVDAAGNASDPWGHAAPTMSWWVGLQGPSVLQPVLELNGLMPGAYDGVSWTCCPAGFAWYSFPLIALPGDVVSGTIARVPGAPGLVFETVTTVTSPGRGAHATRLTSDMGGEAGWAPTWAEVVFEDYYVTRCDQVPCGGGGFRDVQVWTSPAGQPYDNNGSATRLATVPWSTMYEVAGAPPPGPPVCGGATSSDNSSFVNVTLECTPP